MSKNYNIGDEIEVKIEKIVPRGFGMGFGEKLTVLVPLSAPGDVLTVRIRELKKRLAFGEIVQIKQAGPERIEPPCPYFGSCGGCDFQQMRYAAQLQAKVDIVSDCLKRIGKIDAFPEIKIVESPADFRYRSRARWHVDAEQGKLGYYRRDSRSVIDVEICPISTPELEGVLQSVRGQMLPDLVEHGADQVEAAVSGAGVSLINGNPALAADELTYDFAEKTYCYSAETFFQANQLLIPALIEEAVGGMTGAAALDLYCGVGLFTLPLADRFEHVTGVEGHGPAVRYARQNVIAAGASNAKIVNGDTAGFLAGFNVRAPDLVVLDPPRSGTEKRTIPLIAKIGPPTISYVSCEPSILARDLRYLIDSGYTIETITAIDLFPQTHHVETVVRLRRNVPGRGD